MMAVDASQGWGDVAGSFWGNSFNFGAPPTSNHIAAGMARHDSIVETGYDPGLGIYRGEVDVEYVTNDYSRSTTLHNPTQAEVEDAMDSMSNSNDAVALKGRNIRGGGSARVSNPKSDPKNWQAVEIGRGRRQWRYVGPRPWREGMVTVGGAWVIGKDARPQTKPYGWHEHHIFPKEFRPTFRRAGIDIDQATVFLPRDVHLRLHGPWNARWRDFLRNPDRNRPEMYNFALQLVRQYGLQTYVMRGR
jgi:hypothetical protein